MAYIADNHQVMNQMSKLSDHLTNMGPLEQVSFEGELHSSAFGVFGFFRFSVPLRLLSSSLSCRGTVSVPLAAHYSALFQYFRTSALDFTVASVWLVLSQVWSLSLTLNRFYLFQQDLAEGCDSDEWSE